MQVVVYEEEINPWKSYWNKLQERYKEVQFFFYKDKGIKYLIKVYGSITRPHILKQHFALYPELEKSVLFYIDSDILLTKHLDLSRYTEDDTCYLSSTPYISAKYFESKIKDIYFHKRAEFEKRDILGECCKIVGIDKQVVINNQENTGGCQYILKDINATFWEDVEKSCIELRIHCLDVNREFFPNEDKGFQSWAIADMCGVLWNLWKRGKQTACPKELDFSWATSPIKSFYENAIYHNAGVTGKFMEMGEDKKRVKMFYKTHGLFRSSIISFFDIGEYKDISPDYCSSEYVKAIKEVEDPVCVTSYLEY